MHVHLSNLFKVSNILVGIIYVLNEVKVLFINHNRLQK